MEKFLEITLIVFITSVSFISYAQNEKPYSKNYTFQNLNINVEHKKYSFGESDLLISINDNNNIITKALDISSDYPILSNITDYDQDGYPEILVFTQGSGSGAYGNLIFFEYLNGQLFVKNLPPLNSAIAHFYQGHDNFTFNDNNLIREFSAYRKNDSNCCPTGGKVKVIYAYKNKNLVEVSSEHFPPKDQQGFNLIIKSVVDLSSADNLSATDCFLEVYVGKDYIGKSKVINNDNSPYFNETFNIQVYNNELIILKVFDKDLTKNNLIGIVKIAEPKDGTYKIMYEDNQGNLRGAGSVELIFN